MMNISETRLSSLTVFLPILRSTLLAHRIRCNSGNGWTERVTIGNDSQTMNHDRCQCLSSLFENVYSFRSLIRKHDLVHIKFSSLAISRPHEVIVKKSRNLTARNWWGCIFCVPRVPRLRALSGCYFCQGYLQQTFSFLLGSRGETHFANSISRLKKLADRKKFQILWNSTSFTTYQKIRREIPPP